MSVCIRSWARCMSFKLDKVKRGCSESLHCTCLIDLDHAAVCHLLNEAQKTGLIVTHAWILVLLSYAIDSDGPPRQCGAHKTLPEVLGALELQHSTECSPVMLLVLEH